jgi:adenylosuccinate synthase
MKTFNEFSNRVDEKEAKTLKFTSFDKAIEALREAYLTKYNVKSLNDLPEKARASYLSRMEKLIGSNIKKVQLDLEDI